MTRKVLTKERRFLFLTTLLTVLGALFFNNSWAGDFLVDTARNLVDTSNVNPADFYHNSQYLLSFASIMPFQSHYLLWDTLNIHPYHFDLAHLQDTAMLVLGGNAKCCFVIPVMGGITSTFGSRKSRYHYGVDLKLNEGDGVKAAFDGVVRISQYSRSYGNCVVIRHYNGLETLYAHLSKRSVAVGEFVDAGTIIGYGGTTGRSTGPHLHFEVRYKGAAINPEKLISFEDSVSHTLRSDTLEISDDLFSYLSEVKHHKKDRHHHKNSGYYVVHKGDTLSKVAAKNGTTVNRLCQVNRIPRGSKLRKGQRLKIK